jgi:hypothetical protein
LQAIARLAQVQANHTIGRTLIQRQLQCRHR